jgi:hypothetical protein
MAVSKRLRYEILRRDNHACRYCGATAPDVKLNVDHVIPQALGGSNAPTNLVASCVDCNAGKTSSMPNATPVADVEQDAFRKAAELKQKSTEDRPSHDPETGMPTCWTFREVELALVEEAWYSAWTVTDLEGPSLSDSEAFSEQSTKLAERGVHIGFMLAAAAMAGSQLQTDLVWGVSSSPDHWPDRDAFDLGCDAIFAWETAWERTHGSQPPRREAKLFFEELTAAMKAGHGRIALMAAAEATGTQGSFYLAESLPQPQPVGGEV